MCHICLSYIYRQSYAPAPRNKYPTPSPLFLFPSPLSCLLCLSLIPCPLSLGLRVSCAEYWTLHQCFELTNLNCLFINDALFVSIFVVLNIKPRASWMLDRHSTSELHPKPCFLIIKEL